MSTVKLENIVCSILNSIFLVPGREDRQENSDIVCSILNSIFLVPGREDRQENSDIYSLFYS